MEALRVEQAKQQLLPTYSNAEASEGLIQMGRRWQSSEGDDHQKFGRLLPAPSQGIWTACE